ncbi:TPA: hypothetical protein ACGO1J_001336 [Streptococcus suis]
MGLSEYKEDLFVRYNHFLNKRVTFKQKTAFIRSLLVELQSMAPDIKVVELREKGTKKSLSRNVYVGDVKTADVIIATYFDSPLYHLGPYYILDKEKQQNSTLIFNGLVSGILLLLGIVFTLFVTNKMLPMGSQHINWILLVGIGFIYLLLIYLISMFSKGVGRKRNIVRNNSTIIYLIDKILRNKESSKKIAYAFLDNGVTNERGLYGLQASVKKNSKILYLDSIGSMEKIQYIYEDNGEFRQASTFSKNGIYRIFPARHEENSYFLTNKDLNSTSYSDINSDIVDEVITQLIK